MRSAQAWSNPERTVADTLPPTGKREGMVAVSRMSGRGSAALAVLLAVVVTLLGPAALGDEQPRAIGGAVLAAEARAAHGESHAEGVDSAVSTAAVRGRRSHGDVTGERHAPPVSAQGASPRPEIGSLGPARLPVAVEATPVSDHPAHRHGVRAPPSPSGI
jgi:hypothetical protein